MLTGDFLKVLCAVFAKGTNKIFRKLVALIDIAADLADKALLALRLGLGLHMILIIGVGHGVLIRKHSGLADGADEHSVGVQIHILLYLQRHKGIDVPGQEDQTVVGAERFAVGKLIHIPAALEAKYFKYLEGRGFRQAVDVHLAGLLDDVVGVVA